jgi:UDP-N-acetylmuramate--alanine ligase
MRQTRTAWQDFVTYGFGEKNCWRAVDVSTNSIGGSDFSVIRSGEKVCEVSLPLPGHHNVLNALAALVAALALAKARDRSWVLSSDCNLTDASSLSVLSDSRVISKTVAALESYQGIARRVQLVGSVGTCAVYDDYAHHPTAIRAVIRAMRQRFIGARLVVVFQPHTFSRTAVLLHEFADALSLADRVIVTAVYDARAEVNEEFSHQVSGQDLARLIGDKGVYFESLLDATRQLVIEARLDRASRDKISQGSMEIGSSETNVMMRSPTAENIRTVFLCLGAGSSNQLSTVVHTSLLSCENDWFK